MLRRIIEGILIRLCIIEAKKPKEAIEVLLGVLPGILACMVLVGTMRSFGLYPIELPWYRKLWYRIKRSLRRIRRRLVGW